MMVGRVEGVITPAGFLKIGKHKRLCPYNIEEKVCGDWCAQFCAIKDKDGKVIGAYLGCSGMQWTFSYFQEFLF